MTSLGRVLRVGAVIAMVAFWAVALRPANLGGSATFLLVRGTSMLPTYPDGDLLLMEPAPVYLRGDAVAYRVPAGEIGAGHLVIHRIVGGTAGTGFDVQGDNNEAIDPWHPHGGDIVGKVRFALPMVGFVMAVLREPVILAALASSMVVGWTVFHGSGKRVVA